MMPVVCVRMDEETKKKFDAFCSSVGITISAAVNMFAKMTIREDRLPFDVCGSSFAKRGRGNVQCSSDSDKG